jgi:hypothetical protein
MFTRDSLRKKGQGVMHDLISGTCGHGLHRSDCCKCGDANVRSAQFFGRRKTAISKEKKAAAKVMACAADMKWHSPCHTNLNGVVKTTLQQPYPNSIAGLPNLQQQRPDSNAALTCGFGSADAKLKHLGRESVTGCDNASTQGSFDGCSMHSAITSLQSSTARSEDGNSQVGEPCTQPVLQASTLRAALLAVPPPHLSATIGRRPRARAVTEEYGSNVPSAQSSPAMSAGRSIEETWEVAARQIRSLLEINSVQKVEPHQVEQRCDDASKAKRLSEAAYGQEEGEQSPPPVREPMYVRVPRLEATMSAPLVLSV